MSEKEVDGTKRKLLVTTTVVGGAAAVGVAAPFVASMFPSERARAAGAPVEADVSNLAPGEMKTVEWRGQPVWILRRDQSMLDSIKASEAEVVDPALRVPQQPEYAKNEFRSVKPEFLVLVGICTHLGCSPQLRPKGSPEMGGDWAGGFYCACHGSKFDLAGRVYKGVPAPTNMKVPPHTFLSDSTVLIGEDKKA